MTRDRFDFTCSLVLMIYVPGKGYRTTESSDRVPHEDNKE